MTFLLFLASLALLHYLLGRADEAAAGSGHSSEERVPAESPATPLEPVATPGLLALGRALDEHGRGRTPQAGEAREVQAGRRSP